MAILQSVLQKLSRKPELSVLPASLLTEPAHRLAHKIERFAPLFDLQEKRQLLEVCSHRTGESYQSMILAVDVHTNTLEMDEPFPLLTGHLFEVGDELIIKHHDRGRILTMSAPLVAIEHQHSTPVYRLLLPESIGYQQRRQYPRINLSRQQPLSVRLQSPLRTPWYATANNISAGGMRVVVGGNVTDQLMRDTLLPNCEFELQDRLTIRCQATVKAFRFQRRPYRHTEISLAFEDLGAQQSQQLHQLINTLMAPEIAA